ncbi:MAG: hypothetical protein AAFN79_13065 [Pseudomonadota bacterium]
MLASSTIVACAQTRHADVVDRIIADSRSDRSTNREINLMGRIGGAREYCGLDWRPGFREFQSRDPENVQENQFAHSSSRNLMQRFLRLENHVCSDADIAALNAYDP